MLNNFLPKVSLSSCVEQSKKERQSDSLPNTKIVGKTDSAHSLTNTWIDDLKNLRTAISKANLK